MNEIVLEVATQLIHSYKQKMNLYIKDIRHFSEEYLIPTFLNGLIINKEIQSCLFVSLDSTAYK